MVAKTFLAKIVGWSFDLIFGKLSGDLIRSFSFNGQAVYPTDHFGGLFINDPVIGVIRIFQIAIRGDVTCMGFAGISPCFKHSFDLLACITDIPFVHDVQKRSELARFLMVTVDTVIDSDKMDLFLPEQDIREESHLKMIPSNPAQILGNHCGDLTILDAFDQAVPCRTVKGRAGPSVIREMNQIGEAMLDRVVLKHLLLMNYAVAVTGGIVIAG